MEHEIQPPPPPPPDTTPAPAPFDQTAGQTTGQTADPAPTTPAPAPESVRDTPPTPAAEPDQPAHDQETPGEGDGSAVNYMLHSHDNEYISQVVRDQLLKQARGAVEASQIARDLWLPPEQRDELVAECAAQLNVTVVDHPQALDTVGKVINALARAVLLSGSGR